MSRTFLRTLFAVSIVVLLAAVSTHASTTVGSIDPSSAGNYKALLYSNPHLGADSLTINFGKFTAQSAYNIAITDLGFNGYAWGADTGWIVTNCINTASGCTSANGYFKVSVDVDGVLSGYAWGENTGWINFGPFTNTAISRVKIGRDGLFGGTLGTGLTGYAWSEQFGWIVFDCSNTASCVETDYRPASVRAPGGGGGSTGGGGGGSSSGIAQCADHFDNDGDRLIDYPQDPGCVDQNDNNEYNAAANPPPGGDFPPVEIPPPVHTPPSHPPVTPGTFYPPAGGSPGTTPPPVSIPSGQTDSTAQQFPRGDVGLPAVRDVLGATLRTAIQTIVDGANHLMQSIATFMQEDYGRILMRDLAILGLIFFIGVASLLLFVVPAVPRKPGLSPQQEFLLYHEVGFTNVALFLFGAGFFAAVLFATFYPSLFSGGVVALYILVSLLRGAGAIGSYASVLLSTSGVPLANTTVRLINADTKAEIAHTITSAYGRIHLAAPHGNYYFKVMTPQGEVTTKTFGTTGGAIRHRFEI